MSDALNKLKELGIEPEVVSNFIVATRTNFEFAGADRVLKNLSLGEIPITLLAQLPLFATITIGGTTFPPDNIRFERPAPAESKVSASGQLAGPCRWELSTQTQIDNDPPTNDTDDQGNPTQCYQFYYKTTITLTRICPAGGPLPARTPQTSFRITLGPRICVPQGAAPPEPEKKSKGISSGTDKDGKQVDKFSQPDGTEVEVTSDGTSVKVDVKYPDGHTDSLNF